jgi:NYN domain
MERQSSRPILSAVFVDYDNIYLSLKRKNEDVAKRFAKDASSWVKQLELGNLITPTNTPMSDRPRRLVMNRCYGNPVPRRNQNDNSTDMNSFPFVRHHFLRAGFEIVDCPPLTAQLKNSSDIRMVMDIRDYLDHKTDFDEFIILSSDADFTPVLHRLRSHAKHTVIFANDHTAAPYIALSDGEVREADLIALLLGDKIANDAPKALASEDHPANTRKEIVAEVVKAVLEASAPQPLEALADRATKVLGHEKTAGSNWGNAGSFRELLLAELPENVRLTDQAPYFAYDVSRVVTNTVRQPAQALPSREPEQPAEARPPQAQLVPASTQSQPVAPPEPPGQQQLAALAQSPASTAKSEPEPVAEPSTEIIQQQIARIHEACQAPPISPPEYNALFNVLAAEISENQLQGVKTLDNVVARAKELGIEIDRDDARFVLDVVSEADPWFENGASAKLFAGRFRNFVVARCRSQGLNLSADELDLIDAWFAGAAAKAEWAAAGHAAQDQAPAAAPAPGSTGSLPAPRAQKSAPAFTDWPAAAPAYQAEHAPHEPAPQPAAPVYQPAPAAQHAPTQPTGAMPAPAMAGAQAGMAPSYADADDFPRIVRNRLKG